MFYMCVYLVAVVAANLSVAAFGVISVYVNAFLFIGLTLTVRDRLHEHWEGRNLALRMGGLILIGAIISAALNWNAARVATASLVAFACAESVDALVFHHLRSRRWFIKANGSNFWGALIDSIVFPTIAFGAVLPSVMAGQFAAKLLGGLVWATAIGLLHQRRSVAVPAESTRAF